MSPGIEALISKAKYADTLCDWAFQFIEAAENSLGDRK
jgi:hypothetical protein